MSKKAPKRKPAAPPPTAAHDEARLRARQLRAHAALEREIAKGAKRLEKLVRRRDDALQHLAEFIVARRGTHRLVWKEPTTPAV